MNKIPIGNQYLSNDEMLDEDDEQLFQATSCSQDTAPQKNYSFFAQVNQPIQRNRLRAIRTHSKAIVEAATKNGLQTVDKSGSKFVVPITMQAHPTQISDHVLSEKDDILSQREPLPYCCHCHSVIKTWRGFEYHVLKVHIKYRPYRCFHCQKENFYTEEEGRFHLSTSHPNGEITLVKNFDPHKEMAARSAFKQIFLMCRDGPEVTKERIFEWEKEAAKQVMKFQYLRFKRPVVVTKKLPPQTREVQTEITGVEWLMQQMVYPEAGFFQHLPLDFNHVMPHDNHQNAHLDQSNYLPRSSATQHNKDSRERENRLAGLMHTAASSND